MVSQLIVSKLFGSTYLCICHSDGLGKNFLEIWLGGHLVARACADRHRYATSRHFCRLVISNIGKGWLGAVYQLLGVWQGACVDHHLTFWLGFSLIYDVLVLFAFRQNCGRLRLFLLLPSLTARDVRWGSQTELRVTALSSFSLRHADFLLVFKLCQLLL